MFNAILLVLLSISGAAISPEQSGSICPNWPLCGFAFNPARVDNWTYFSHSIAVGAGIITMILTFIEAWRKQKQQTWILVSSSSVFILYLSQSLLGSKMVVGVPLYLIVIHQATAIALWIAVILQVILVGLTSKTSGVEMPEFHGQSSIKGYFIDLLQLTKPIVVVLLLVTTFAGMVIGAGEWPPLDLVFWTLLGGFLAAGGSGAINQYIDRKDDTKMQRTQNRPIPSGRLTPGEGLAFGVMMSIASFYIMVAYVNLTAALLTLMGIVYYVVLYSIVLKKTTVQNIVIGGGAGAIPPLVGWAAVTGSLNFPSLLLFAVIFIWTPPHFWALALVRRKDYARAGVPMMPVVRGERETRKQILIYTIELVLLTLALPILGLGGGIYFIGATLLGLWLVHAAWRVWKMGGNKVAWKMYRYSSMYLAFLFFALMIDALI